MPVSCFQCQAKRMRMNHDEKYETRVRAYSELCQTHSEERLAAFSRLIFSLNAPS